MPLKNGRGTYVNEPSEFNVRVPWFGPIIRPFGPFVATAESGLPSASVSLASTPVAVLTVSVPLLLTE